MKRIILAIALLLFTQLSVAEEDMHSFHNEEPLFKNSEVPFDIDLDIKPTSNDFELKDYSLISSESNVRQALLKIHNTATGQRILVQDHIVAIYADGHRAHPLTFDLAMSAGQTVIKTIQFGEYHYPIVKIIMR